MTMRKEIAITIIERIENAVKGPKKAVDWLYMLDEDLSRPHVHEFL